MFNPSQEDVRRFFCDVYAKHRQGLPMEPLETIAAGWIDEHPEYHEDLIDADAAVARVYDGSNGRENPFLHLSMHLSISEQCSIDQPRGIRQAVELLAARRDGGAAARSGEGAGGLAGAKRNAARERLTVRQSFVARRCTHAT